MQDKSVLWSLSTCFIWWSREIAHWYISIWPVSVYKFSEVKWPKGWAESQFHVPLAEKISYEKDIYLLFQTLFLEILNQCAGIWENASDISQMKCRFLIILYAEFSQKYRNYTQIWNQNLFWILEQALEQPFGNTFSDLIFSFLIVFRAAESIFGESLRSVRAVEVNPKMKKIAQRLTKGMISKNKNWKNWFFRL